MRADQLLVERGLAASRSQAVRLIAGGLRWRDAGTSDAWRSVVKNKDDVPESAELELADAAEARYVSRGGLKLEGALKVTGSMSRASCASTWASPPAASPIACCSAVPRRWWVSMSATGSCMRGCARTSAWWPSKASMRARCRPTTCGPDSGAIGDEGRRRGQR
jgi:hypothetical protein